MRTDAVKQNTVRWGTVSVGLTELVPGESILPAREHRAGTMNMFFIAEGDIAVSGTSDQQLGPADVLVVPEAVRAHVHSVAGCSLVSLSLPEEIVPTHLRSHAPEVIRADAVPLAIPVRAFVSGARGIVAEDTSDLTAYYAERLLQEMAVGILVESRRMVVVAQHSPNVFGIALSVIAVQREDPALTPAVVARAVNLSLRQLERVFAAHGTTPARAIRRERLAHAMGMLRDPRFDGLTVDEIARFAHFSNSSSLARAMAAEGHPSPTRVRADRPKKR